MRKGNWKQISDKLEMVLGIENRSPSIQLKKAFNSFLSHTYTGIEDIGLDTINTGPGFISKIGTFALI